MEILDMTDESAPHRFDGFRAGPHDMKRDGCDSKIVSGAQPAWRQVLPGERRAGAVGRGFRLGPRAASHAAKHDSGISLPAGSEFGVEFSQSCQRDLP
jgi:hypothetical protein